MIVKVLSITEDQLKVAQEKQVAPTASLTQFEDAMKAAVDEDDDINNYSVVLKKHIHRMKVAESVITTLRYAHVFQVFSSP